MQVSFFFFFKVFKLCSRKKSTDQGKRGHTAKRHLAGTQNISSFFSLDEDHSTKPHPNINCLSYHGYQLFPQWFVAELLLHFAILEHCDQFGLSFPTILWVLHFSASNFPKDFGFAPKWNQDWCLISQINREKPFHSSSLLLHS